MTLNPSKVSTRFARLQSTWAIVDALYGGTASMRAAGIRYLPKNEKESQKDYDARLNRTTLWNAYKRSIQHAVSRTFSTNIQIEGYPTEVSLFIEDVDAQNRDLTQFSKETFVDALQHGVSYTLIDFPERAEQPSTLADAQNTSDRPYWVPISAAQVLAAYSSLHGGTERLTHFRFTEFLNEPSADGLDEVSVQQVKVFNQANPTDPVEVIVYRLILGGWIEYSRSTLLGMPQIPVVPTYTNRTGFFIGSPPLSELADLNIAHWQSSSEQRNILHVARVPFLHIKGLQAARDPETGAAKEQEISIHSVLTGGESAQWVETNGNALAAGAADLADLEAKMEAMGSVLTINQGGNTTATETSVNAATGSSILREYSLALADSLEQCLYLTGFYLNLGELQGSVLIDTTMTVDVDPIAEPKAAVDQKQ